jgi:hypothetical protein
MSGETPGNPVYFKFVRDDNDQLDWTKILIMLGITVVSGYLAAKSQRWGAEESNPVLTVKMKLAQKRIGLGHKLQVVGRSIEEAGWEAYERI